MGNSKKRKREEKAKVQFKKPRTAPGKHLPKGTNVTKTEFRVAKIVIPGQVESSDQTGPITSKKLGLKDVLNKLRHFSQTVRNDGLEGLKELLSTKNVSSIVNLNLSNILVSLVPLVQDKERKLRRLTISLLPLILAEVSSSKLVPLHSILSAHLGCSLTHIDQRIQQDGLTMLDTLIEKAPSFVQENYENILPNCLDQISSKKVSEKGPSVAANMTESMTALQWRVLVLTRVDKVLDCVVQSLKIQHSQTDSREQKSFNFKDNLFCSLSAPKSRWISISSLALSTDVAQTTSKLELLMPLLIETWVEARANDPNSKKGSSLNPEVVDLLFCEVGVLDKLLILEFDKECGFADKSKKVFKEKFMADIQQHFLLHIPYASCSNVIDETNALLCCIQFSLDSDFNADALVAAVDVVARKHVKPITRLRLAKKLLHMEELKADERDLIVETLVKLLNTEAFEVKLSVMALLCDEAKCKPNVTVNKWVEELPHQLMNNEDPLHIVALLDSCIDLAKSFNELFARQFLLRWNDLSGHLQASFSSNVDNLLNRMNFIKLHCESCLSDSNK